MSSNTITGFFIATLFFLIGLLTLTSYGVNWDTINHLPRGQVYLHYFLTGEKDFSNDPQFILYRQDPKNLFYSPDVLKDSIPRVSLYKDADVDLKYYMDKDGGHPPLSDILSSGFNLIFFEKLGVINDIDSYRLYGLFMGSLLIGLIFWWVSKLYGKYPAFVAALSLATYPLFFAEFHFNNEKDVPETFYWTFFIFLIWGGVVYRDWKRILLSGVIFGLALGTKLNIIFAPIVILLWLSLFIFNRIDFKQIRGLITFKIIPSALAAVFLAVFIFVISWPFLWPDPITKVGEVIGFYKDIGTTTKFDPRFLFFGINSYPSIWILLTTPLVTLILFFYGIKRIIGQGFRENNKVGLLFLLWFLIPIIRSSFPGANIYGGVRQIMEYIPAMSIIAAIGSVEVVNFLSKRLSWNRKTVSIGILILFLPIIFKLIAIHPYQNVYFNPLIGGLKGAKELNIPFWGNTFGSAHREGVEWMNANLPLNATLTLSHELGPNLPKLWIRRDIYYNGNARSGYAQKGEFVSSLTYFNTRELSYYNRYLENVLNPIHEIKVDDVAVLKIWKNDPSFVKEEYKKEKLLTEYQIGDIDSDLSLDLGSEHQLSKITFKYKDLNCIAPEVVYSRVSIDGQKWQVLPGNRLGEEWGVEPEIIIPDKDQFILPFAADHARFVHIITSPKFGCLQNSTIQIYTY